MSDYIVRVLAREAGVRALACLTTETVRDAARRHGTSPIATAALGYGLTAVTLLGALLKVQERIGLKVAGGGPLRKIVTESDSYGRVRGYVAVPNLPWPLPITSGDVGDAVGRQGLLTVVKDVRLKELAKSVVPLQTGDLDTDLVYYLMMSEQVPSLVEIGVHLDEQGEILVAGGVLLQSMPGREPLALSHFANRLDDLPPLERLLTDGESPEQILATLFTDVPYDNTGELCRLVSLQLQLGEVRTGPAHPAARRRRTADRGRTGRGRLPLLPRTARIWP